MEVFILKIVILEISEYFISLKSRHPYFQSKTVQSVLEVPMGKLELCKIEKGLLWNFFIIMRIRSKRDFYYRTGVLSKNKLKITTGF